MGDSEIDKLWYAIREIQKRLGEDYANEQSAHARIDALDDRVSTEGLWGDGSKWVK